MTWLSDAVAANLPEKSKSRGLLLAGCLSLVALGAAACGGNGTSGLTGNGKAPADHQVAIANCDGERSVAPVTIVLSCTDGNVIVGHARWTTWDTTSAVGTGVLTTNNCQPTCSSGTFTSRDVDLVAKVPLGQPRRPTFSVLVVTKSDDTTAIPAIYQLQKGR